jgi:hypothetical protein
MFLTVVLSTSPIQPGSIGFLFWSDSSANDEHPETLALEVVVLT